MRHRFAFFAVLATLVLTAAGCAGDASSGQAAAPATRGAEKLVPSKLAKPLALK